MSKVNKAFSLDPEVFILLDRYCRSHEEIGGKRKSRSAMVNEAIRWYLGDTANLVRQRDVLQRELRNRNEEIDSLSERIRVLEEEKLEQEFLFKERPGFTESENLGLSWWRRLLLGR